MGVIFISRQILVGTALLAITSCNSAPNLPAGAFAGCYKSQDAQRLLLSVDGSIYANGTRVGNYKVVAPVGGKHGPLIEATGLNVVSQKGSVTFLPGSGGFLWPVTDRFLSVVAGPDIGEQFTKGRDAYCH